MSDALPIEDRRTRRPFHVLTKPAGPACNLSCRYCFYREKAELYQEKQSFRMPDDVLERYVQSYTAAHPKSSTEIEFAWQGGEPTLLGVSFYERVVELQARYARSGQAITNTLQTNGTLLDGDWGRFLAQHDFLVGVSIDGPEPVHDSERVDPKGGGSFRAAMAGIEVLRRHGVRFNTLTTLHRHNCADPSALYDFLKGIGSTFLQFIPIVEHAEKLEAKSLPGAIGSRLRAEGISVSGRSIEARQWAGTMMGIFDRWLECGDVGKIFVRSFDVLLGIVAGHPASVCVHAEHCGGSLVMEHNGDVYACDHFVSPEYKLGNVMTDPWAGMLECDRQLEFGRAKRSALPAYCRRCSYLPLCWGGCPKDRISTTPDGEPGLAYLCEGYRTFFRHSLPTLQAMARCLELGHPAADYRRISQLTQATRATAGTNAARGPKVGRNAPCPCGSGAKYKRCCG
jgi:uncharacterized protein